MFSLLREVRRHDQQLEEERSQNRRNGDQRDFKEVLANRRAKKLQERQLAVYNAVHNYGARKQNVSPDFRNDKRGSARRLVYIF
jgi:hypothetical protein